MRTAPPPTLLLTALLAVLAGLAGAQAVGAQQPDSIRADTAAPTVVAQQDTVARTVRPAYIPPRFELSVTVGTAGFGALQTQAVAAERLDATGTATSVDTLTRTLGAEGGLHVSASALYSLAPAWAVRGGVSWARASLSAGYAGTDVFERGAAGIPIAAGDDLTVLSAEAALRFRMRSARRLQPYAELGGGIVRVDASDPAFPGANAMSGETSLAAVAALGAVVPVWERLSGRVQATGQFFRTPARTAPAGATVGAVDTLRVSFAEPRASSFADAARELTRILRLEVGVSLELGRVARPRVAPAAPPSEPRP